MQTTLVIYGMPDGNVNRLKVLQPFRARKKYFPLLLLIFTASKLSLTPSLLIANGSLRHRTGPPPSVQCTYDKYVRGSSNCNTLRQFERTNQVTTTILSGTLYPWSTADGTAKKCLLSSHRKPALHRPHQVSVQRSKSDCGVQLRRGDGNTRKKWL